MTREYSGDIRKASLHGRKCCLEVIRVSIGQKLDQNAQKLDKKIISGPVVCTAVCRIMLLG
jgi:hypothetical protein